MNPARKTLSLPLCALPLSAAATHRHVSLYRILIARMIARVFRQLAILLGLALIPAVVSAALQLQWNREEPLAAGEVRVGTAREWGDKVIWVDARSRAKFEKRHIPGAVLLNEDEWDALVGPFLDAWDPDKEVVVYCDGGGCEASTAVADRMREELKIGNVHVLKGGWNAWLGK